MTCWNGSDERCKARWIVCDSNIFGEARDLLEVYSEFSIGNINIRMINNDELIRYAYANNRGAGFILELDPGIFDTSCLSDIKAKLLDRLTIALYGDPRWQLIYHILDRQMLPTP